MPPPGWQPDPSWPPPPPGWQLWVNDDAVPASAGPPPGGQTWADPAGVAVPPGYPAAPAASGYSPYYYGYGGQPTSRTSGFAIASLVLGILGFLIVTAILGIIFGIIALTRIRAVPQRGKGLAIAGLVTSGLWLALIGTLIGIGAATYVPPSSSGSSSGGSVPIRYERSLGIFALRVGDCFDNPASTQNVTSVTGMPCTRAHNAQVFAQFKATGGSHYPGSAALKKQATTGCNARIAANVDRSRVTSTMTVRFVFPEQGSWFLGRRTVSCLIVDSTADLKSSLLKSKGG